MLDNLIVTLTLSQDYATSHLSAPVFQLHSCLFNPFPPSRSPLSFEDFPSLICITDEAHQTSFSVKGKELHEYEVCITHQLQTIDRHISEWQCGCWCQWRPIAWSSTHSSTCTQQKQMGCFDHLLNCCLSCVTIHIHITRTLPPYRILI